MRNLVLRKILSDYKQRRLRSELVAREKYEEALKNPEFARADKELKQLNFQLARCEAYNLDKEEVEKLIKVAKRDYQNALKSLSLKESDLLPTSICKHCKDTGYVDGELCVCVKQKLIDHLKSSCGMSGALEYHFPDEAPTIFEGTKQEKSMQSLYKTMLTFCEKFPNTKYKNILLCGAPGVGKSFLISATANKIMEKGFSVLYVSAFEFNDLVLKYHTSPIDERSDYMDDLLSAELLIIDDLGTEPIRKNVSIDYLFSVLSYRMEHNLHTIFSTNLNANNLLERYGERVFSRLFHKKYTYAKRIDGDDLRLKK